MTQGGGVISETLRKGNINSSPSTRNGQKLVASCEVQFQELAFFYFILFWKRKNDDLLEMFSLQMVAIWK